MAEGMGVAFIEDNTMLKANFSHLMGSEVPFGLFVEAPKQGGELTLYSHSDWTPESKGIRLSKTETFKKLANRLPNKGIAFNYSIGSDLDPLLAGMSAIPEAAQYKVVAESVINLLIGDFLKPSMGVTYMEEGHMVSDQYAGFSTKQVVMVVPTIFAGGLGAAMAIPAFQKVRTTSQEKAVTNNLRQIASAADQYFLENGVTEVSIDKLVGEGGYIRVLKPVAGESYEGMIIQQGEDISVVLENGSVISMPF
jgi:type IV pilus assembly protein PilA